MPQAVVVNPHVQAFSVGSCEYDGQAVTVDAVGFPNDELCPFAVAPLVAVIIQTAPAPTTSIALG
jgi:hypothetical protein